MLIVSGECKIPACLIESSYLDNKKKRHARYNVAKLNSRILNVKITNAIKYDR